MTKSILAVLSVLAVAVLAPVAQAESFTPELEADYSAALTWWSISSPPQCASVTEELLPTDPFADQEPGNEAAMRATQPKPEEEGIDCHIYAFEDALQTIRSQWGTSAPCVIEAEERHEVGHLLGHGHSDDPTNVMHAPTPVTQCEAPAATAAPTPAAAKREHPWRVWRALRRVCRRSAGPYRKRCWQEARDLAAFIRRGF